MRKVKVTRSYQITIPADIRRELGIEIGDELAVRVEKGKIIFEKVESELPFFKLGKKIGEEEIQKAILRGLSRALSE